MTGARIDPSLFADIGEPDHIDSGFLGPDDEPDPSGAEQPYTEPDTDFVAPPKRARGAEQYEKKTRAVLGAAFRASAQNSHTVADAATLMLYAPKLAYAAGDLAAADERIARGIDWLTEGTENPYLNFFAVAVPFAMQVIRNHEPILEPAPRGFAIPFTKGKRRVHIPFKIGIRLGFLRNQTDDPENVYQYVFNDPGVKTTMEKLGIQVATYSAGFRHP